MSRFIYGAFKGQICNIELHWFCDSSLQVYPSVAYIRATNNLDVKVNLICSKTNFFHWWYFTNERSYNSSIRVYVLSFINEIITICIKRTIFEHCKYLLVVWLNDSIILDKK